VRRSAAALRNLERAAGRMLSFFRDTDHWLVASDHNHLRITRILRCLALLVNRPRAEAFRDAIEARVAAAGNPVNPQSRDYWRRAAASAPAGG
jgi:hypothetical protein